MTLRKFASRSGDTGKPLPALYSSWEKNQVDFRRGATSMIAGTPGSYKSVLALNMVAQWALKGHGILYFSADSDESVVARRMAGILTGDRASDIEARIQEDPSHYEGALARLGDLRFAYDSRLTVDGVKNYLAAWETVYGEYPEIVVVDNLINFAEYPDDWAAMLAVIREMDDIARETGAHVLILHHAKTRSSDGKDGWKEGWPPADWEVSGKVTQLSRLVLTLAAVDTDLYWSVVKNTNGPMDRQAKVRHGFVVEESLRVKDTGYRSSRKGD
jgi:KaiC/GvpD/RAD55 family RecA-like ATPase